MHIQTQIATNKFIWFLLSITMMLALLIQKFWIGIFIQTIKEKSKGLKNTKEYKKVGIEVSPLKAAISTDWVYLNTVIVTSQLKSRQWSAVINAALSSTNYSIILSDCSK